MGQPSLPVVRQNRRTVALSNRTLALLAKPFEGGGGPSHSTISLIWSSAGADDYLIPEEEANKLNRVLSGLRTLAHGRRRRGGQPALEPDEDMLNFVVADLATRLMLTGLVDEEELEAALNRDGVRLDGNALKPVRPVDEPADQIANLLDDMFGTRSDLDDARNHFEQAERAFDRGDWEAANAQYRSACDATYDALAHSHGCRSNRTGGRARQWLQDEGLLEDDEAALVKAFMAFAGRGGSHAGRSDAADAQLRRHFAAAIIVFAIAKFE